MKIIYLLNYEVEQPGANLCECMTGLYVSVSVHHHNEYGCDITGCEHGGITASQCSQVLGAHFGRSGNIIPELLNIFIFTCKMNSVSSTFIDYLNFL